MKQRNYTLALLSAIWLAGSTAWAHAAGFYGSSMVVLAYFSIEH